VRGERNRHEESDLPEPVERPQKPWRQLAFVIGEAALSLISSGVLFVIISRVSGAEVLGAYALALAWLMLFQGASSFGIPEFLMREVGAYGRDAAGQVFHAMLLGLGSGLIAFGLALIAVRLLGYSTYLVQAISVASLALIPAFLTATCRSVFLALRQMHLAFLALLVEVTIVVSGSLYLVRAGHGVVALMITLVVAKATSAAVALPLLYCRALPVRPSFNKGLLMRTARTVFAFGVGNILAMLTMRINVIMVSLWVDIATVGRFAAATKVMEIGFMIPGLFVQLLMSRIAHSFNTQGNRDPNRFGPWYQVLFALVVPTSVGVWVFAGLILQILFGTGFGNAVWILRILMIYLVIESADAVMSIILKAAQRQREDISRLSFNPLTNILLSAALLPTLGTIGAAIGRVGGVAASATLRHLLIARELGEMRWLHFTIKPTLISVGVGSICYFLSNLSRPAWLLLFYVAATALLMLVSSGFPLSAVKDMMSMPSGRDSPG
jgi:O-antigen/teichoic acid export membrane protein